MTSLVSRVKVADYIVQPLTCHECNNTQDRVFEDYSNGCVTCMDCGLQLHTQLISEEMEWRSFDDDDQGAASSFGSQVKSRVGGIEDLFHSDLTTYISDQKSLMAVKQRTANESSSISLKSNKAKCMNQGYSVMDECVAKCDISPVLHRHAKQLFHTFILQTDPSFSIAMSLYDQAAIVAIHIASIQHQSQARQLKELYTSMGLQDDRKKVKQMHKVFRVMKKWLHSEKKKQKDQQSQSHEASLQEEEQQPKGFTAESLIPRVLSRMNMEHYESDVIRVLNKARDLGILRSRPPSTVIGGVLYWICREQKKQTLSPERFRDLCSILIIGTNAITCLYKELQIYNVELLASLVKSSS